MGTVWRAVDVGLQREVAIKEVRPVDAALHEHDPALAAQQRERVLRESRALARLQHPNVVSIYQIIESDDSPYPWIVMEFVRGTSLEGRLREGVLTPAEAAGIGRDVLAALRAAHAAGVMHRDVKPGNVLLRTDGSAVLTDFGIAALHDSGQLTATGEVIGSPEYIAPERLRGDETRTASDLWSLAMLLYVAVEGHHPLRRATTMATLAAVMTEPVPPARRAGPLGPALAAVLVPDPAARPTGEAFDRMLAAVEHGGAPFGPPTPAGFAAPLGPPTPAGFPAPPHPGFPTPHTGFPSPGPGTTQWARPGQASRPVTPPGRRRAIAAVVAVVSLAAVLAVGLVVRGLGDDDPAGTRAGAPSTGATTQRVGAPVDPGTAGGATPAPTTTAAPPATTAAAATDDLLSPAGARQVVGALTGVIGGTKVAEMTVYDDHASASAPTPAVKNGFDDFEYRDGTATREGPDRVDPDRAVLDLNDVNWDALPALWDRAAKELGVPKPTLRYFIVSCDIIDDTPSLRLYLSDDYGGAYLEATLKGEVLKLYPRDS
ncbi:serine/threonine protein kinase [Actinokineospora bangkokensis]|uniref:non-specific serine/threonine protein kinase n=2 Tax=Actinokineospora bangkokensis TaxID=1193682 RepID=A0A1Q9LJV6_9PSEU|nr:serine/threonine protein kinase [Actinokineospora bangkokensis]